MTRGLVTLYCPICTALIVYDDTKPMTFRRHSTFGIICSQTCYNEAEMKYARLILGKREELPRT